MQAFDLSLSHSYNHSSRKITTTHQKRKIQKTPPSKLAHETPKTYIPPQKKPPQSPGGWTATACNCACQSDGFGFSFGEVSHLRGDQRWLGRGSWIETGHLGDTQKRGGNSGRMKMADGFFTWNPGVVLLFLFCCLAFIQRVWCEKIACGDFFWGCEGLFLERRGCRICFLLK